MKPGNEPHVSAPISPKRSRSRFHGVFRGLERLLACVGLCALIYHFALQSAVMISDSMAPALQGTCFENGDHILIEKVSGHFRAPRRWEVYFFYNADGVPVAKRIVGLPGEKI